MKLGNYVGGRWVDGEGSGTALVDPVLGTEVARATSDGIDLSGALAFARERGGPALRAMTFAERGAMLASLADALESHREAYVEAAIANSGNTRADALVDIDGGIRTLAYYAGLGVSLGATRALRDGTFDRLGKVEAFQAIHINVPMRGVAIHVNAFNFPSWGMWEKAATSLLAGMPVLVKPATQTALLAHDMARDAVATGLLPDGAFSIVCAGGHSLPEFVTSDDVVTFTGSAHTGTKLRSHARMLSAGVRFNCEADSLNSSILGPEAGPGTPEFDLYVNEVVREITVKAGQKCTAIRRGLVPAQFADAATDAIAARLRALVVGNPRNPAVQMGPVVSKAQQRAAFEGITALAAESRVVTGGPVPGVILDADPAVSAFVAPTLLRCDDPDGATRVHDVEVFGPCCTLMPYTTPEHAFRLAARGGGSLVASIFTADDAFAAAATEHLAASHGRLLVVDRSVGEANTGHGRVLPMCIHGGPGRAGGGEELGGMRGLGFYMHRVAVQGRRDRLDAVARGAAEGSL